MMTNIEINLIKNRIYLQNPFFGLL